MPLLGFPPGAVVDGPEVWRRDAYGFAVRPQHLQRFREYAKIYKEEEEERAHRWRDFLDRLADAANVPTTPSVSPYASTGDPASGAGQAQENSGIGIHCDDEEEGSENAEHNNNLESPKESDASAESREANGKSEDLKDVTNLDKLQEKTGSSSSTEAIKALEGLMETNGDFEELKDLNGSSEELEEENNGNMEKLVELFLDKGLLDELKPIKVESQRRVRAALSIIDKMMSSRVVKGGNGANGIHGNDGAQLTSIEEEGRTAEASDDGDPAEVESCVAEKVELGQETTHDSTGTALDGGNDGSYFPWREELESLVRGGVPMALRGEIWQAFVGVGARRIPGYYNKLLDDRTETLDEKDLVDPVVNEQGSAPRKVTQPEKWKGQIEKDLPRTFPGHPALDEDGRNALRRLLTAYARHNPSVGYCQAMNFFAGLFLLFMPEENAFWALVGVIDDYFDGYYTEEMIESQVDQLVLEEVVRERFPKLAKHMEFLGVQVGWITGPWFLSIFINMLPWESVLRIWDVILFEGNRIMLFRTTLALLDLYGPALVTTKDAGDAITLLQSLAGSTFDSSQLVLTACMGFQSVREMGLQELRKKYRPEILTAMEERSKDRGSWKDKKGLATKLYSFKHDPSYVCSPVKSKEGLDGSKVNGETGPANLETYLSTSSILDNDLDQGVDLQDQVSWLKVELCKLLEEKRSADLRSEELETALMEMVEHDNRRMLSAKVEKLETEAYELRKAFSDKQEQEQVMLQILLRMEQEQKVAEDARIAAERDAAEQKHAAHLLQEKYEAAMTALSQMEKRAVMAETMLEATKQYQFTSCRPCSCEDKSRTKPNCTYQENRPAF
ncbi:ecotropic viral integration site 5 protein homolog isoform X7 [Zea mays]|uniref:ecotropic viral integration site 5 protein homolog isoform X7 n=1 Tax=Zea mays TaxID=4577 RepID=UPI0004DEBBF3|nr:ecotropic viral integration site 5 protein homolog isoform X7 [Zea mays]XP_020401681.1 ecotropic viral integration site 5 protein homolog isoform X7 [Zea mays]|eukprot:XP_008654415.1 ecotropic viral integration site 5 protein homolog isoform X7 [Zea mays]